MDLRHAPQGVRVLYPRIVMAMRLPNFAIREQLEEQRRGPALTALTARVV
jgi:hypothetical protein